MRQFFIPVGLLLEGPTAGGESWMTSVAGFDAAPELQSDMAGEMQPGWLRGWRRRGLDELVEEERERGCALRELDGEIRVRLLMGRGKWAFWGGFSYGVCVDGWKRVLYVKGLGRVGVRDGLG